MTKTEGRRSVTATRAAGNGTKRAVEVDEAEIRGVRLTLFIAYLLTLAAFVAIVWARGELVDWIAG